jgi:5-oxoprolinase (ATP-hydrolysing)
MTNLHVVACCCLGLAGLQDLEAEAKAELHKLGFSDDRITVKYFLNLRYSGTDTAIMTGSTRAEGQDTDFRAIFEAHYKREFGFLLESRNLLIDDVRVSAVGHTTHTKKQKIEAGTAPPEPIDNVRVYFQEGWLDTPVFKLEMLLAKQVIPGPAIIMQDVATVVVEPGAEATIKDDGTLEIIIKVRPPDSSLGVGCLTTNHCCFAFLACWHVYTHRTLAPQR